MPTQQQLAVFADAHLVYPLSVVVMISSGLVTGLELSEVKYTDCGYKHRLVLLDVLTLSDLLTLQTQTHYLREIIMQGRHSSRHNLGCLRLGTLG